MTTKIAIVYTSGYGHTEAIAQSVAKGAESVDGAEVTVMKLPEHDMDALATIDAIIFGSPTYMGNISAEFATFKDASSKPWFSGAWRDKIAGGFTVSGNWYGDKGNTLATFQVLAAQHGMHWVSLSMKGGFNSSKGSLEDMNRVGANVGLMIQAPMDQGAEGLLESDHATAKAYGKRVAEVAAQFVRGRA